MCHGELTFVDVDTGETIPLGDADLNIAETNITFTTQQLVLNRQYRIQVSASNIGDEPELSAAMISMLSLAFNTLKMKMWMQALMI